MTTPTIIEVAINGSTTKAKNPNVPITAEEIAADALACYDAGATIVHAHCNPGGGPPDEIAERYLEGFRLVWAERPDALIYPTVNFGENRFDHLRIMAKEGLRIGVFDPGSMNLVGLGDDGLPAGDTVYANPFNKIREVFALHSDAGLGPSLAMYEPGFLRTAVTFWKAGRLPVGSMFKIYLSEDRGLTGSPFGLKVSKAGLDAYLELLDDCPIAWAVSAVGGDMGASPVAPYALSLGGHLHIGLEFYGGDRTPSNVELTREAVAVAEQAGRPPATFAEASKILGLR